MRIQLLLMLISVAMLVSCANRVEVPENVNVQVQPVTGEVIVKHVLSLELPAVFTDNCRQQFPNDAVAYNKCVTDYINSILQIINGLDPSQIPVIP